MRQIHSDHQKGFISILGILLSLVIVCVMFYWALNVYFGKSSINEANKSTIKEYGIDTSSQKAVLESTKQKISVAEQQMLDHAKQYENLYNTK